MTYRFCHHTVWLDDTHALLHRLGEWVHLDDFEEARWKELWQPLLSQKISRERKHYDIVCHRNAQLLFHKLIISFFHWNKMLWSTSSQLINSTEWIFKFQKIIDWKDLLGSRWKQEMLLLFSLFTNSSYLQSKFSRNFCQLWIVTTGREVDTEWKESVAAMLLQTHFLGDFFFLCEFSWPLRKLVAVIRKWLVSFPFKSIQLPSSLPLP